MSQCDAIRSWLEAGSTLTPRDAYDLFGTLALHSRIAELRARGLNIVCELVTLPGGKRVGQYRLERIAFG